MSDCRNEHTLLTGCTKVVYGFNFWSDISNFTGIANSVYCCHPYLNLNKLQSCLPGHTNFRICRTLLPASFPRIPAEDVHNARHFGEGVNRSNTSYLASPRGPVFLGQLVDQQKVLHRSRPLGQASPPNILKQRKLSKPINNPDQFQPAINSQPSLILLSLRIC